MHSRLGGLRFHTHTDRCISLALQEAWDSIGNDDEGDVFFLDEVSADGDSEDEEWRSLQLVEDEDEANDLDDNAEWDTGATVSEESIFDMDRQSWSVSAIPDSVPRKKGQPASSIQVHILAASRCTASVMDSNLDIGWINNLSSTKY